MPPVDPLVAVHVVLLILCWLALSTRVYVRAFLVKGLSADDHLLILSILCFSALIGVTIPMTNSGMGVYEHKVSQKNDERVLKLFYAAQLLYLVSTVALKLSITVLLLRLLPAGLDGSRPKRILVIWTGILSTLYGIAVVVVAASQCRPVARFWDHTIRGKCMERTPLTAMIYIHATISFVTDGIFAVLPITLIWNTGMERKTKISVSLVLGIGLTTCIVNIARFFYASSFVYHGNRIHSLMPISLTNVLEVGLGILATSMATARPLLRKIFVKLSVPKSGRTVSTGDSERRLKMSGSGTSGHEHESEPVAPTKSDIDEWLALLRTTHERAAAESKQRQEDLDRMPESKPTFHHISEELSLNIV